MNRFGLAAVLVGVVTIVGCGDSKSSSSSASATGSAATAGGKGSGTAAAGGGLDYSEVDKLTASPKTEDDFDKITSKCLVLAIEVGSKGKSNTDDDPDYWKHCTVGPARARANLVIKESTPEKMHTQCLAASVQADTIVESKKAEAEEFKKLGAQIDKACGL